MDIHNIMDDPVFYVSSHNDDENYDHKDDNNDETQGSSTVPYPRAVGEINLPTNSLTQVKKFICVWMKSIWKAQVKE